VGVQAEAIKSGPLKDMGSPFKHLTDDERRVMQGIVDEYYGRFLTVLKNNRTMIDESNRQIATDGRVFSGFRAKEIGLVDDLGLLEDALDLARTMAKAPNAKAIMYKRPYG